MKREESIKSVLQTENKINRLKVHAGVGNAGPMEMCILSVIYESGGRACVSDIAKSIDASMPNVSRALKAIEADGKVERVVDKSDRRTTCVLLTECGRAFYEDNRNKLMCFFARAMARLSDDDIEAYARLINKVYLAYKYELEELKQGTVEKGGKNV